MMTAAMMCGVSYNLGRTPILPPDHDHSPPQTHHQALHSLVKRSQEPRAAPFLVMSASPAFEQLPPPPHQMQGSPTSPVRNESPISNSTPPSPPNLRGLPKECGVCRDVAKSMHFGGLSCDSCKAFFRRSVQNNAYRGFSCPYERNCNIGVSSRKACQYCRFQKCCSIGMEKSWVMTEDERRRMMQLRQDRKKNQHDERSSSPKEAASLVPSEAEEINFVLGEDDRKEIHRIKSLYKRAYAEIPYDEESINATGCASVLAPWMIFCKRLIYFFRLFEDFIELGTNDQVLLLKTALSSAGIIMGSVVYDSSSGTYATSTFSSLRNSPNVSQKNVAKFVPPDLYARVQHFFQKFRSICADETMGIILILITLYTPESMGLHAREAVQSLQERYIRILHQYVKFKFKEKSSVMFPKAIVSLADIRELADRTWQMQITGNFNSRLSSMLKGPLNHGAPDSIDTYARLGGNNPFHTRNGQKDELVPVSESSKDVTYKEIIDRVLDFMKSSSKDMRAPFLIPLIMQLVKKLSKQPGSNRPLPGRNGSMRRSSHQYHQRAHRLGHKRRLVEIKQDKAMTSPYVNCQNSGFQNPMENVVIKTEYMDADSQGDYLMTSSSNDSTSSVSYSSGDYIVQPVSSSSNCQYGINGPQNRLPDVYANIANQQPPSNHLYEVQNDLSRVAMPQHSLAQDHSVSHQQPVSQQQPPLHYTKQVYHQMDYQPLHHPQPCDQNLTELLPVDSSFVSSANEMPNTSLPLSYHNQEGAAYAMLNNSHSFTTQTTNPGKIMPTQMLTNASPPQLSPMSPFSPPSNSLTPPIISTMQQQPYNTSHTTQQLSPVPAHSPYSSSSSSSSPEDFSPVATNTDFGPSEAIGVDVITQLLDSLSNTENMNEIPAHFLKELNCILESSNQIGTENWVAEH